jgi:hypothetical protein
MTKLRTLLGKVLLSTLVSAFAVQVAHAAPTISWSFTPGTQQVQSTDSVAVIGTFVNTGPTTIVGISSLVVWFGSIGTYYTNWIWGPSGGNSFWDEYYAGLSVAPGGSFSFQIGTIDFANAPGGSYTFNSLQAGFETTIGVYDTQGAYSGEVASANNLVLNVGEPPALALAALALAGVGLSRRRVRVRNA